VVVVDVVVSRPVVDVVVVVVVVVVRRTHGLFLQYVLTGNMPPYFFAPPFDFLNLNTFVPLNVQLFSGNLFPSGPVSSLR